jgi:hypothetical protein
MAELYREKDASRYDTEKLQKISIDGLTCAQVEEYFAEAIKEGKHEEDEDFDPVVKRENGFKKESTISDDDVLKQRDSFSQQDHDNSRGAKAPDVDIGSDTEKSNTNDDHDACDNDQTHCSRDIDSIAVTDMNDNNSWRSTAIVGVLIGVACLVVMSRAVKGKMR